MFQFINKLLILFLLLLQPITAQWYKVNLSYIDAQHLTSVIQYKNKIYVGDFTKGVLYTEDYCNSWQVLNNGLTPYYSNYSVNNFFADTSGLFALNYDGIFKLDEENNRWQQFGETPGAISLARKDEIFIAGVNGNGIYYSTDNGNTWLRNYLTAGMLWNTKSIVVWNNKFFASGDLGVHYTTDDGNNWQIVLGTNTTALLFEKDTLYAATTEGLKFTADEGINWNDVGPEIYSIKSIEKNTNKFFAGGDLAIKYFTNELMDWIPATRNSPQGFPNQVQFLKIISDTLYSCNYGGLYRRAMDDFNYPELSLSDSIPGYLYNEKVGETTYLSFGIGNNGFDTLKVYDVISSNPDFKIDRTKMDIPPEWGFGIGLTYKFTDPGIKTTEITVITNDTLARNNFFIEIEGLPIDFKLEQNYPNPFNPNTTIDYALPSTQMTSLKVYNSIGELVKLLVNEVQSGGEYKIIFNSSGLSAGIYFYQLQSGENIKAKKMILLK